MFQPGDETVNMREGKKDDPLPIGWFALFTPSDAMPKDRGLHFKRRGLFIIVGLVLVLAAWGVGQSRDFVENVYANGMGQGVGRALAAVTGILPTSVAELLLFLGAAWFLTIAARAAWHVAWRKRRAVNAIACGGLHFGAFAAIALGLFYAVWGLNYFRAPMIERQGWAEHVSAKGEEDELYNRCVELVDVTNAAYLASQGSEDYGEPSAPMNEWSAVDAAIDVGYERVQAELGLDESFAISRGKAKPVAAGALMDYLQISGFYFPWTGEANYNRGQPACNVPHVVAHEKAHQRCITSEDEANFFGFLACVRSDDSYARYSGWLFAQRQLLGELMRVDPERGQELLKRRHPGVQRDVNAVRQYWERFETGVAGEVGKASHAVNDAYLKANQVEGGIESYRMSAKLLIVYARKKGSLLQK
jgi:hypothetical protein